MQSLKLALLLGLVCFAGGFGTAQPLHADWIGELRIGERASLVELKIETTGGAPAGAIIYPVTGQKALALTRISSAGGRVSFAWPVASGEILFEGEVSTGILSGKIQLGSKVGTLHLVPVANSQPKSDDGIFGYYELSPGHLLSITSFPLGPVYVDYTTRHAGVLFPTSETEFFAGPSFQVPVPIAIRASLTMDAERRVTGIRWNAENSKEQFGKKLRLRQEEVVFRNGDITLSGTLTLPNGKGPHPAIVRIHGAGGQTRRNVVDPGMPITVSHTWLSTSAALESPPVIGERPVYRILPKMSWPVCGFCGSALRLMETKLA